MWTFLNPIFLYAAGAAMIPLVLHLIQRRRVLKVRFSTIRFLKLAQKRSSSRIRMENLLLWLLRTLLLLLLALAFAGPVFRTQGFGRFVGTSRRDVAIVWDASYSMSYASGWNRVWDTSRETVQSIVNGLNRGDRVCIFLADDDVTPLIEQPSSDLVLALSLVKAQECGNTTSQLRPALQAAANALKDSARREREIYVVTDGQALPWRDLAAKGTGGKEEAPAPAATNAPAPAAQDEGWAGRKLDKQVPCFVAVHGVKQPENVTPLSVELEPRLILSGRAAKVTARLAYSGAPRNTSVSLMVDEREVGRRTATLGAGSDEIVFNLPGLSPGVHPARIEVPADALTVDDAFHFLVRVDEKLSVLCVGSDADTFFLLRALNPGGDKSAIEVNRVPVEMAAGENLQHYACVFLCNALPVPGQLLLGIERYVRGGGVLVVFPGEKGAPGDYEVWNTLPSRAVTIRDVPAADAARTLRLLKPDDPVFAGLKLPPGSVPAVSLKRELACGKLEEHAATLIAAGADDPFLLSRTVERGRTFLFTTTADRSWGNLPLSPFFLPLAHQLVQFSTGLMNERLFVWTARVLPVTGVLGEVPEEATLISPAGTALPVRRVRQDDRVELLVEKVTEPGIYHLAASGSGEPVPALAVNIDRRESDLTPLDTGEIPKLIGLRNVQVAFSREDLARMVAEQRIGRPLNETFLWAALLVAILELLVASRAARKTQKLSDRLAVEASGRVRAAKE